MGDAMKESLNDHRARLNPTARDILSSIWKYKRERQVWIPTRVLHHKFCKDVVISALKPLGGSVVRIIQNGPQDHYDLTFLGALLTDQGEEAEKIIAQYLKFLGEQFAANPEINAVKSRDIEDALGITKEESVFLRELIQLGGFWGGGSFGATEWEVLIPNDIDDFASMRDFHDYIARRAFESYDPLLPLGEADRIRYDFAKARSNSGSEFQFIKDEKLQQLLLDDWREAQAVLEAKAWKSTVILCGGILEGMLLDSLLRDENAALKAYRDMKKGESSALNLWALADLVDVSAKLGILHKGAALLGHALREFRNLIHPARQLRLSITITQDEANIALNAVKVILRELSERIKEN
jgi:hypothetical protein